jgi:hypothetical protein
VGNVSDHGAQLNTLGLQSQPLIIHKCVLQVVDQDQSLLQTQLGVHVEQQADQHVHHRCYGKVQGLQVHCVSNENPAAQSPGHGDGLLTDITE